MTRFVLALIRFTALSLSFLLSTFTAAGFVTFVLFLGSDTGWLREDLAVVVGSIGFMTGIWLTLCQVLFAPCLLIFLVAEFARLSSLLSNIVLGGLCAVAFMVLVPQGTTPEQVLPYPAQQIWMTALAAGFVGGFAHWIFAGHRAGRWLGPSRR